MSGAGHSGQGSGIRFLIVGVLASILQFVLTYGFMRLGLMPALAVSVAFMVAFASAYSAHRRWTFSSVRVVHGRALPRYALTQCLSLALGACMAEICARLALPHALTAAAATLASGGLSYVLSSRWVFSGR